MSYTTVGPYYCCKCGRDCTFQHYYVSTKHWNNGAVVYGPGHDIYCTECLGNVDE